MWGVMSKMIETPLKLMIVIDEENYRVLAEYGHSDGVTESNWIG